MMEPMCSREGLTRYATHRSPLPDCAGDGRLSRHRRFERHRWPHQPTGGARDRSPHPLVPGSGHRKLTTYRPYPKRPRRYTVWLVSYQGGDVCMPTHGPGPALGTPNLDFVIEAHTGKVLGEGSSGRPVACFD